MDRLDSVFIDHIEGDLRELLLSRGAISDLTAADAIDYLIISSQSKNYDPAQGGWVSELQDAGISVAAIERDPAMDMRPLFPCWISKEIMQAPGHYFKRLVVFEPVDPAEDAAKDVWIAFQALRLFAGEEAGTRLDVRVAVPILSSLAGEADFSVMLRMIFFAAVSLAARGQWGYINIFASDERSAQASADFAALKSSYLAPPLAPEGIKALVASIRAQYPSREESRADPDEVGLTERQFYAVYQYTVNAYGYINSALRKNDVTDPDYAYFQPFIEALSTALGKLKNYSPDMPLARYIHYFSGIEDIYRVSNTVREAAYTSTTKRTRLPWDGAEYKLNMKGHIGKEIEAISGWPDEQEVLFDSSMFHLVSQLEELEEVGRPVQVITTQEVLSNTSNIRFSHL